MAVFLVIFGLFVSLCVITTPVVSSKLESFVSVGEESRSLDDLSPSFRLKVDKVILGLKNEGYPVWISSTWRSKERQEYNVRMGYSQSMNSRHRGGGEAPGTRRSRAIDLRINVPLTFIFLHGRFYQRLQEISREQGLCTGGSFQKSNEIWALFGLGWDPGHVTMPSKSCTL